MFKITNKIDLADKLCLFEFEAKRMSKVAMPGQFLIVRIDEKGERVPLTISDYERERYYYYCCARSWCHKQKD